MSEAEEVLTAEQAAASYGEDAIRTLSSFEHIRKRPGMYIGREGDGSYAEDGIYILLKEVIDNAVDEFIMGCGRRIEVSADIESGHISVRDYGRGIPLEKMVDCVAKMNTGGKYSTGAFKFSCGLNGVGAKAVNALSREFAVRSVRDGRFREAHFLKGKLQSDVSGETADKNGTFISFTPDNECFPNYKYRLEYITDRLWKYAYLNPGLQIFFNGERYYSKDGLLDLLAAENDEEVLYDTIHFKSKELEFALTHTAQFSESVFSFVNGQYTRDGGTHLSAFRAGVLKGVNKFSGKSFKAEDLRSGMLGAISIKVQEASFESQTKNKLTSTDVTGPVTSQVEQAVEDYLHKHLDIAEILLGKINANAQLHKRIQEVKKQSRDTASKCVLRIPKLKDCKFHVGSKWPRKVEPKPTMIFLTEGDSAAGSLEKKRDVDCQAIFALRGKPQNCCGKDFKWIYGEKGNEELTFLIQALGIEESIENLRYDKIIIATDADVDGMHIRNLLLTFFLSYFSELVTDGCLFVLETPLFQVKKSGDVRYCYNEEERDAAVRDLGGKSVVTRFKGLGEIDPADFGAFIGRRMRLSPVTLDNMKGIPELIQFYMGGNTPERKEYILKNLEVKDYE